MNPWRTMWIRPRATIRSVVAENPKRSLWVLASIYGFSSLLNSFQSLALGGVVPTLGLVLFAIIISPFWGYLLFAAWGWLVSVVGKWFKGQGSFSAIRAAYAWSCVPLMVNVVIWLMLVILMGGQIFQNFIDGHLLSQTQIVVLFSLLIAKMAFVIWSIVLYLNALAEVQKFSILRAILNVVIAGVIAFIVLAVLYSLLIGLTHMKGGVST